MNEIKSFRGQHACLSNFYGCLIEIYGEYFSNSESAFQSQKDLSRTKDFVGLEPKASKALGYKVNLREDWDQVKDQIMYDIVSAKFHQHSDLSDILLETGEYMLVEGNSWHDNYWGNCDCQKCKDIIGKNKLGEILMKIRTEIRSERNGNDSK